MAATVTPLLTNVTLANNNTGFSVIKVAGTGGTPSAISEADVFIQGTGACSVKVSNQSIILWYDNTTGINLTGNLVYIWVNMLAIGLTDTIANSGLAIALGSSTTNYSLFSIGGSDTLNYPGGWFRAVIDPAKTATSTAGSGLDITSCRYFGAYSKTNSTAKFDNLVVDRIDYGTGIRVSATSTTDDTMGDIYTADNNVSNKYGIVRRDNGIYYCKGLLRLGDSGGASTLTDKNKVVVFERPQYYQGGLVDCYDAADVGLIVDDGASANTTDVTFGTKIGSGDTAVGANGVTFLTGGLRAPMDFGATNANSDVKVYGSTLQGLGAVTLPDTGTGEWVGNTIDNCNQVVASSQQIRGCIFSGYTPTSDAALLWVSGMDIKNSRFLNNTRSIEHTTVTAATYDGLLFSGNTYDIYLSATTGTLEVSPTNGANPSTSLADGSSVVSILTSPVTTTVLVIDEASSPIQNARVRVLADAGGPLSEGTVIINGLTNASGIITDSRVIATDQPILGWARKSTSSPLYKQGNIVGTIDSADGVTITVQMVSDE